MSGIESTILFGAFMKSSHILRPGTITMTRILIVFLLVTGAFHFEGKAQFADDFGDGDFTSDPTWSGDDALFVIVDQGGNNMLRSNSPGAATYHLSTPSEQATNALWEFFIDLQFATSGANYVDVYLVSPQADLSTRPDGYFVRIGDTNDHIVLYRRQGTTNTALISSPNATVGSSSSNPFRIRVTRDPANNWTLFYDQGATTNFTAAGVATDATFNTSTHFGIVIVQSTAASAVNSHFFDDFVVGDIPVDDTPPVLLSATIVDATTVDLLFDEPLSPAPAESVANYSADSGLGQPTTATLQGSTIVRLTFASAMVSGTTYTVTANGLEDLAGNALVNGTASFLYFVPDQPQWREVVINELMVDQTPSLGLPESEYYELFNATQDKFFELEGWRITTNTTEGVLPAYALAPGEYVLLVPTASLPLFDFVPNRVAIPISSTGLVNSGTTLTLLDPVDNVIDQLSYTLSWYNDPARQDGGWSLEQINPFTPCSGVSNWAASDASLGGSPGQVNTVLDPTPDTTLPRLTGAFIVNGDQLELLFNEAMDGESLLSGTYSISPSLGIGQVQPVAGSDRRVLLALDQEPVIGTFYTITVSGVVDCIGNPIDDMTNSADFAIPEPVSPGDIVINEVLYDTETGGSDFVELYNRSEKVLDLSGLQMAREITDLTQIRSITSDAWILMPGEYVVVTSSTSNIAGLYPQSRTERFIEMNLPTYVNTQGVVTLLDAENTIIDQFRYHDNMHFSLIVSTKGFSLERVDPDRPTQDETNWQTASEAAGRTTPGFQNSQYSPAPLATGTMTIDPAIFSPDNDGYQDLLTIAYSFEQQGFAGTIMIFDVAGREVRRLMTSKLLGTSGSISWDGTFDDGSKGRIGPYIIMMEAFDLDGNVERFKQTVTLAHYLD